MTDIEQARTILTKWGEGVTPGPWKVHPASIFDDEWDVVVANQRALHGVQPIRSDGSYAEDSGYMSKPDATLIVAMTDPALREALDGMLAEAEQESGVCHCGTDLSRHRHEEHTFVDMGYPISPEMEHLAAVIIAIDQRMNA